MNVRLVCDDSVARGCQVIDDDAGTPIVNVRRVRLDVSQQETVVSMEINDPALARATSGLLRPADVEALTLAIAGRFPLLASQVQFVDPRTPVVPRASDRPGI